MVKLVILEKQKSTGKGPNLRVGMELNSLIEHIRKHPDIGTTPEEYLGKALEVLGNGSRYKNGLIKEGIFLSGYHSEEFGCYMVNTVHRKF